MIAGLPKNLMKFLAAHFLSRFFNGLAGAIAIIRGIISLESAKNRIILILSSIILIASIIVHFLHRVLNVSLYWIDEHPIHHIQQSDLVLNIFLSIPILLLITTLFFYRKNNDHSIIPLLNTLTITFGSMSMIAGGEGMVEYHFSIFMVVAIVGYYEKVNLIIVMTLLFTIQHLLGFFFLSEYVFGQLEYPFSMLIIHALFLLGTSGAITWQTIQKSKLLADLDQKQQKQQILSGVIEKLSISSEKLINASVQLNENYDLNRLAINGMAANIREISSGADIQRQQTEGSSAAIQEINHGIHEITETAKELSEISIATADEANEGNVMIYKTVQQMQLINEKVSTSSEMVKKLNHRSEEIGDIVKIITDIASQTNLLALNAAIEAARAGEHGKGFAVVADEVRKLAEESVGSASKITSIIKSIQEDTVSSAKSMDQVINEAKTGLEVVKETGEIFGRIYESINGVANRIKQIALSSTDVSAATKQVSLSLNEMSYFAEMTSANTQNVVHSSEEQLASVEILSTLITSLNDITLELQELIRETEQLR